MLVVTVLPGPGAVVEDVTQSSPWHDSALVLAVEPGGASILPGGVSGDVGELLQVVSFVLEPSGLVTVTVLQSPSNTVLVQVPPWHTMAGFIPVVHGTSARITLKQIRMAIRVQTIFATYNTALECEHGHSMSTT